MASGSERPVVGLYVSAAAHERLARADAFLRDTSPAAEVLIVGATRGAADDLARRAVGPGGASFGWHRYSLIQLAARVAVRALAAERRLPASPLGAEAVSARAIFRVLAGRGLQYFAPVARTPGFAPSVARSLGELRLAGVGDALAALGPRGSDLARLMAQVERELAEAGAADRAAIIATALAALEAGQEEVCAQVRGRPLLLIDLAAGSTLEARFLARLAALAAGTLLTLPLGDERTRRALEPHVAFETAAAPAETATTVGRLRSRIFVSDLSEASGPSDDVQVFSAPGEAREAVEIARRLLAEAGRGVPFDEMAVLVRAPHLYLGLLEHALSRAGIPAWFDRGTRRPDPAGRALLALLLCAEEGLSARRFAEYLSLAQVPDPERVPDADVQLPADDEALMAALGVDAPPEEPLPPLRTDAPPDLPVVDGSLRAPWRWEALLVESAVIGGRERWVSRLDGLAQEYRRRLAELGAEEPEAPRAVALARDSAHLEHLRAFALPIVGALDDWREADWTWGEWLNRLAALAPRVLRRPARVQRVLAELRPMADVGPVGIGEVRKVLSDRLRMLAVEPPARRFGRVFVGSPEQARGRAFRVAFVPGLAERVFPQKLREDPLLLDDARRALGSGLPVREDRATHERLQLRLAIGAVSERLDLSYPRLDVSEARPRVPSFYALDVQRALTGRIPSHEDLEREAYRRGGATLAWPAPADPARSVDALEHDLAVLRGLLDEPDPARARGRARYLLSLNACLGRSVRERWSRHQRQWSEADGLMKVSDPIREALAGQRLGARPYSLSALQHYAACPYRFLLSAIYRLAPREDAVALQRLDPLTKGSIFHRIQAEFLRALKDGGRVPVRPAALPEALATLSATVARVAADERVRLAPAIPRVWDDEVAAMERDLARWVHMLADDPDGWVPQWFEFGFGLPPDPGRDPASVSEPVRVDGRFLLRGSIDLVERHPVGALRVTDHKTGRARWTEPLIVGGGEVLQPVLYSLVLEAWTGDLVTEGRLSFCTTAGGFTPVRVLITDTSRRAGIEVLEIVDRGVEHAMLAPYPRDGACQWCDFQAVCGPDEERRTRRKPPARFADLEALREKE